MGGGFDFRLEYGERATAHSKDMVTLKGPIKPKPLRDQALRVAARRKKALKKKHLKRWTLNPKP